MPTPIYVSWDRREGRLEAKLFIASYLAINDAEIGRHEQLAAEFEDGSPEALALDENPFQYEPGEEDDMYQDITGERVPKGFYAFCEDGDLFLGAFEDLDGEASEQEREETWKEFREMLEKAGFKPEWIDGGNS